MGNAPSSIDRLAVAQHYQDHLVAKRLPAWITKVHDTHYPDLVEALQTGLACQRHLARYWARVENIEGFVKRRLQAAMHERFGAAIDIDTAYFRHQYFFTSPKQSAWAGRLPVQDTDYYDIPLLSEALRNFTEGEAKPDGQPKGNMLVDASGHSVALPSAVAFAKLCRELDLGAQYQRHLDSILDAPAPDGWSFEKSFAQLQRCAMLLDALEAWVQDTLTWAELEVVIRLFRHGKPGGLEGAPVIARQLRAFGCDLQQIVVLDAVEQQQLRHTSKRVLVYIPGDPHGPWSTADNITALAKRTLAMRLKQGEYRQFFRRFVRYRDSQRFFAAAVERLNSPAALKLRGLDEDMKAYPTPLFEHLAAARIADIKNNAATIATPVGELDRAMQEAYDKHLEAVGLTLLDVAALFVPWLGGLLHAEQAWRLLKDVFQAVEDWRDGDIDAALAHTLQIGEEVARYGMPEELEAFRSTWERAEQVDRLVPALLDDGSEKLWNQDLAPFRSETPPSDAEVDVLGVHRRGDQQWIEMDGHFYEVFKRNEDTWHLLARGQHAPEVVHNGAGAWRLWSEQPAQWRDTRRMFRRLGGVFNLLDDVQIDQVLAFYDLDGDALRGLHVYGRAPEADLVDTVQRIWLANRIRTCAAHLRDGTPIDDQALLAVVRNVLPQNVDHEQGMADAVWSHRRVLLQRLYDELNPVTDDTRALRRDFASLHRLAAEQLLLEASDDELQRLRDEGQVPLHLGRLARVRGLRIRGARVCEALCFDTPQSLDLAQVVLTLVDTLPGASDGPGWALFDGDALAPLMTSAGRAATFQLVHRDGLFLLRDDQGRRLGEPGELFQTLAEAFDERQREALALDAGSAFDQALRARLVQAFVSRRREIAQVLGRAEPMAAFLAPLRLSDGRVGYPLSGSWCCSGARAPVAIEVQVRYLYPAYDEQAISNWIQAVKDSGQEMTVVLGTLRSQLRALRTTLSIWQVTALSAAERQCRRIVRKHLISTWRELVPERAAPQVNRKYVLTFSGRKLSALKSLPSLPAGVVYEHVAALVLRALNLETIPESFLQAFPQLRALEVTHCQLYRLPLHSVFFRKLQVLDLLGNDISLDSAQAKRVERCGSLIYLNLSHNPLYTTPSIAGMPELNTLRLVDAELWSMPQGISVSSSLFNVDIRDNALRYLPANFLFSPVWNEGRVRLEPDLGVDLTPQQRPWNERQLSRVPQRLRWQDYIDPSDRDGLALIWPELEKIPGSQDFFELLGAVEQSQGSSTDAGARDIANRLYLMMKAMLENPQIRQELFDNAGITGCDDNATLRFVDLEVRIRIWGIMQGDEGKDSEQALLNFAGQLWRLERLDHFALRHALGMVNVGQESVEVVLALRIALNDVLDLGLNDISMRYAYAAELTLDDIEQARDAVANEQTESALVVWIAERDFWQRYLSDEYEPQLRVPQSHYDELERLESEGGTAEQMALLQTQELQRVLELRLKLTRDALARTGANWKVPVIFDEAP